MPERSSTPSLKWLLELLDRAYDRPAWHGPNLRGSLRRVKHAEAAWRPHPGRHNIWEHAIHAAYWKYTVWRRLTGEKRGSFPLRGSNWFSRPVECSAASWRNDLALLDSMHVQLRAAVAELRPGQLGRISPHSKFSHAEVIAEIAAHDVYHAGQIQLLRRLHDDFRT